MALALGWGLGRHRSGRHTGKANLVGFPNANFIGVYFLFQGVPVDTEHLRGFHLIAIVRGQSQLNKGLFNLLDDNVIEAIEFDLGLFLLRKQNLKFTLNKLLQTDRLKIGDEKII
jgi:hypothetical protein